MDIIQEIVTWSETLLKSGVDVVTWFSTSFKLGNTSFTPLTFLTVGGLGAYFVVALVKWLVS